MRSPIPLAAAPPAGVATGTTFFICDHVCVREACRPPGHADHLDKSDPHCATSKRLLGLPLPASPITLARDTPLKSRTAGHCQAANVHRHHFLRGRLRPLRNIVPRHAVVWERVRDGAMATAAHQSEEAQTVGSRPQRRHDHGQHAQETMAYQSHPNAKLRRASILVRSEERPATPWVNSSPEQPNRRIRDPYVRWCGRASPRGEVLSRSALSMCVCLFSSF